jgi:hypothetical protein
MLLLILALVAQVPAAPVSCATPLFHRLALDGAPLPARAAAPRPAAAGPAPGDTVTLWTWNMSVMPPRQYQARFVCADRGDYCYVMVHDSVLAAGLVDSAAAARIVERFERSSPRDSTRGVWQHNTGVLGLPPDELDGDSAIYLLYYNIGTFGGSSFDGFWMSFDQYYDTTAQRRWGYRSNEIECVYLDCHPNDPSSDYRVAIAAHEMGHMIHWNYDPAESLWVQEGACELAMWLFGAPDPVSGFPGQPDNDLTRWTGSWADYIKTYLFFLYLYEQHGGRAGTDLIHDIIRSPLVSIAGVEAGLDSAGVGLDFDRVFDDWVLANRINDTVFLGGRYGYFGENVPRFGNAGVHYSYPVDRTGSLSRWAGEYILFAGGTGLELEFDGADQGDFRVFVVGLDTIGRRLLLDSIPLDAGQRGTIAVPGFDTAWQHVYLVPASHHRHETMTYRYLAAAGGIAEGPVARAPGARVPAVVRGSLRLPPGPGSPARRSLLDASGRRVLELRPGPNDVRRLAPGVYFVRASGAGSDVSGVTRVVVTR